MQVILIEGLHQKFLGVTGVVLETISVALELQILFLIREKIHHSLGLAALRRAFGKVKICDALGQLPHGTLVEQSTSLALVRELGLRFVDQNHDLQCGEITWVPTWQLLLGKLARVWVSHLLCVLPLLLGSLIVRGRRLSLAGLGAWLVGHRLSARKS